MTVHIIDDSENSRIAFQEIFESIDMESNAIKQIRKDFFNQGNLFENNDFIISDYKLKNHSSNYSKYDGDKIIAEAYKHKIPGILCSSCFGSDLETSRNIIRYIPKIILTKDLTEQLSLEYILKTKELICDEFQNKYTKQRRPWRALLRTTGFDPEQKIVFVEIPSWQMNKSIRVSLLIFSENLKKHVIHEDYRFHAIVNLDCEKQEEIYIDKIEDK